MAVLAICEVILIWYLLMLTSASTHRADPLLALGVDVIAGGDALNVTKNIIPMAYVDFDGDKFTDIVALSTDGCILSILFGSDKVPLLRQKEGYTCHVDLHHEEKVVGISAADFTGNGLLDLMVSIEKVVLKNVTGCNATKVPEISVSFFEGTRNGINCYIPSDRHRLSPMVQEPTIVDLNGDMIADLVGETWNSVPFLIDSWNDSSSKSCICNSTVTRPIANAWLFSSENKFKPIILRLPISGPVHNTSIKANCTCSENLAHNNCTDYKLNPGWKSMLSPSSNAFVDIDGDNIPEFVTLTKNASEMSKSLVNVETYKIHNTMEKVVFDLDSSIPLDRHRDNHVQSVGQSLFIDLTQSGKLYHVVPYCSDKDCINENGLKVVMGTSTVDLPIEFTDWDGMHWRFISFDDNRFPHYRRSFVLRVGDFNLDGYPDLIATMIDHLNSASNYFTSKTVVFENVPCQSAVRTNCPLSRTFKLNFDVLGTVVSNVTMSSFFDLHEDGVIDILAVHRTHSNRMDPGDGDFELTAYSNDLKNDVVFLKAMVLSGLKCEACVTDTEKAPFGNILPGSKISYKSTNSAGLAITGIASQRVSSAHSPLDLPYSIFGLGRHGNFIEHFEVCVRNKTRSWKLIIPNSQVAIVPSPIEEPWLWKIRLFLTPSKEILLTFGGLSGFCFIIACVVFTLHRREQNEDRLLRIKEASSFVM